MSAVRVKICGLKTAEAASAAVAAGAAYIGFNFHPGSRRYVTPDVAASLASLVPPGRMKVGLFVDLDEAAIAAILDRVPLDMLQLHGGETPDRVRALKHAFGLPVMKALPVGDADDVAAIAAFETVADQILLDARPLPGALTGGNGLAFDWTLIAGRRWSRPWMLAGGLTPVNVAAAIRLTGARQVDVSSGVESSPGVKDKVLIEDFIRAARTG